jgi:putative redox protein
MVDIHITYEGALRCSATHQPSGTTLSTDAPRDNHGRGESFSPTDLVATALGTCMITTMGIIARKNEWKLDGTRIHVQKQMTSTPPRKIARLPVTFTIPPEQGRALSPEARAELEHTAHNCPVRLALEASIEVPVTFDWGL